MQPQYVTSHTEDIRSKYRILRNGIGHGNYGVVRKCINRETNEVFAVKTIPKTGIPQIKRLRKEVSILQSLSHPNIIELTDVYEDKKYIHLVTPFYGGGELRHHIIEKTRSKEGHFSEQDAANLVQKMLDAISYCHNQGIMHRDLKPENFIFESATPNSTLKLIDFGLSTFTNTSKSDSKCFKLRAGTSFYMAPEVIAREYTNKCDIWSVGVILYILLCGYPPFYGENDRETLSLIMHEDVQFPEEDWKGISSEVKELLRELLSKNYVDRPSAEQALSHPWFSKFANGKRSTLPHEKGNFIRKRLKYRG